MTEEKKSFSTPAFKVYSHRDLSKNWFVYWSEPGAGRQRKYGDINTFATHKERQAAAQRLIEEMRSEYEERRKTLWDHIDEHLESCAAVRQNSVMISSGKLSELSSNGRVKMRICIYGRDICYSASEKIVPDFHIYLMFFKGYMHTSYVHI